ncbi:lytic polysaccharide monooxygenase [Plenodomus tracheiphilus IPT5]|uniref:Lytic polysaccharide monooxygenase n=1 Tax=Plenodomus tracheiphilus IPT5 TaxID=1408161 RepID=A0A6A7ALR2_9PLEO|nr:lytic polysaccharide monooxygenase [Plenodomus tracheiphilus IPT5]
MPMNGDPNYQGPQWGQQPFPCKGHHRNSTRTVPRTIWHAGSRVTLQIYDSTNTTGASMHDPGAAHSGGSCQASFSYDNGDSWIVVQSWEGNCLRVRKGQEGQLTNSYDIDQNYSFDIPDSLPGADQVILAWTWLNASGNREFYMSCSPIRLIAANSSAKLPSGYPMYIANLQADPETVDSQHQIWSPCHVPQNVWIRYPQRYKGINPPIVADSLRDNSQIQYLELKDDGGICGSDNKDRAEALGLRSGSDDQDSIAPSYTSRLGINEKQYQNSQLLSAVPYRATQLIAAPLQSDVLWAVPSTERSRCAT